MAGRFAISGERAAALALVVLTSATLLTLIATPSGATFTSPSGNPANSLATATLAAPTAVTATVQSNGGTVRVGWTATASSWASGHRVFRATLSGGPYSQIAQIAGLGTTIYDDAPGTGTFYYVVRGYYNAGGAVWESTNSGQATAKPLDHFTFAAIATQHSGTAFSVTITAQAQDGSTVTGFTGTVSLSTNAGSISPLASNAFIAGALTQNLTVTAPYRTSQTVSATGGTPSRTGTSGAFTLNHFRTVTLAVNNRGGGTVGRPETLDSVVLTFSEAANTASFGTCNGMTLSGSDVLLNNANPDTITANGSALKLGTVVLGNNGYFTATMTATNSGCVWSAGNTVLTVYLNVGASVGTVGAASTATYTPNSALSSAAGEVIDTAQTPTVTAVLF